MCFSVLQNASTEIEFISGGYEDIRVFREESSWLRKTEKGISRK
jgi:hypothetical protein